MPRGGEAPMQVRSTSHLLTVVEVSILVARPVKLRAALIASVGLYI